MAHTDAEVAIVGAGPVGLTLALFLARRGIGVRVLEREQALSDSPRAIVYLHPLLRDLDAIGMLEPMIERGWLDREGFNLHLRMLDEVISIPNTVLESIDPHPYNIHLGQDEYCRIALRLLSEEPTARVDFGVEVTEVIDSGDAVQVVRSTGETLSAKWVVGADGARSIVRSSIGASLEGFTWAQRFVGTNVRFDFRSHGFKSSNMYVDSEIGCVVAQITSDGLWRCTYQESLDLAEETVAERMAAHFERLLGAEDGARVEVVDFRPYRMHQRLATSLRKGRMVLAGDAAHLTNPTGGLGLTTGLYDVFLLQEVLAAVLQEGADESLLDAYAKERSRVFREISSPNATHFKRLVYDSTDAAELSAAVQGFRDAANSPESQRAFLRGLDMVRSPSLVATQ